ncbi:hypothetical protein G6F55_013700 [Rhizopus delemar]|nr:hypothetical protein G6F55_013700 [Rhizopus delemar]
MPACRAASSDDLAEPGLHDRRPDRRGHHAASAAVPVRRPPIGAQAAGEGTPAGRRAVAGPLSASTIRRHAPARDDRDGPVVPAAPADRRRTDHRAGRDGTGRTAGPAA